VFRDLPRENFLHGVLDFGTALLKRLQIARVRNPRATAIDGIKPHDLAIDENFFFS